MCSRIVAVGLLFAALGAAQPDPPARVGRLNIINGNVSLRQGDNDDWTAAVLNRPLTTGDQVWTDNGARAAVQLGNASMRLGSQSSVSFARLDDRSVIVRLTQGSLNIRLRQLDSDESFEVDTPNQALALLRPGDYRVDVDPAGQMTHITVRAGQGEVTASGEAFSVPPGQAAMVSTREGGYKLDPVPPRDAFDDWCSTQDRREQGGGQSVHYVPAGMIGAGDLDDYGAWRPAGEYGTVWFPRVAPGWAPYHYGHWIWVDPWGWTWVDDAPWGFAPFHYGRWVHFGGAWGWVPGPVAVRPVYAPAMVAWVGGPRFSVSLSIGGGGGVGWVPLAPGEVYRPAYRGSPAYVNRVNVSNTVVNNVTVINNNVTNVRYVNQAAPGGLTAMPRSAMSSGQNVSRAAVNLPPGAATTAEPVHPHEAIPERPMRGAAGPPAAVRPPSQVFERRVMSRSPQPGPTGAAPVAPPAPVRGGPGMDRERRAPEAAAPPPRPQERPMEPRVEPPPRVQPRPEPQRAEPRVERNEPRPAEARPREERPKDEKPRKDGKRRAEDREKRERPERQDR